MFKYKSINVYGYMIIIAGISLLIRPGSNIETHTLIVTMLMILSGIIAGMESIKPLTNKIQRRYHALHAIGLFFYGILLIFNQKTISNFSDITAIFFIFYGISEIIFCFQLFNLQGQISVSQLILRLVLGLFFFLSSILMIGLRHPFQSVEYLIAGFIFILIGIEVIMAAPIVTRLRTYYDKHMK